MKRKKIIIKLSITAVIISLLAVMIILGNNMIEVNSYKITSENLPEEFNGYKIVHISDFHNKKRNSKILEKIKEASPDIICITGDFIDSRQTRPQISLDFAKELVNIAPCYYVIGNHESRLTEIYTSFEVSLKEIGVTVLRNESVLLTKNNQHVSLIGLDDPRMQSKTKGVDYACQVIKDELSCMEKGNYTISMCHRPEAFSEYVSAGIDLALTGHAHGGQVILPLIGGIIAPNQGFYPKYYKGLYVDGKTNMIVNRGLGNSLCPIRFNNRPEIIVIELQNA